LSREFSAILAEAGRTLSYIETVSPSRSDTYHRRIKEYFECDIRRTFEQIVRFAIRKLNLFEVELAIDTHKHRAWCKNAGLNVRRTKYEEGTDIVWEWVVLSVVRPIPIPLMALPYPQGSDLATLTIDLLRYAQSLPIKIKLCLFDRGFYSGHLIDYLEAEGLKYLMLAPETRAIKRYAVETERIKAFKHTFCYAKSKSKWLPTTKIVVIKGLRDYNLYFATNLRTSYELVRIYPRRWQIETNFRVSKEAKIKTKSNESIVRYFYFLIQLLLVVAWNATKQLIQPITFKRYLAAILKQSLATRKT